MVPLPEVLDPFARDEQMLEYASQNRCVLISCDRDDFLRLAQRKPHCGLIILIRRKRRAAERAALIQLIDRAGEEGIRSNINIA